MHYDVIIVGSGFGGSVSALRLAEKGYRVLVLEKGRRFHAEDFPTSNWDLRRFMWIPELGMRGPFKMSFFKHLTVLHGVGVGGGSLVYGNTLPVPKRPFFESGSWAGLEDWEQTLVPHYATAKRMLGAIKNPNLTVADEVLREIAGDLERPEDWGLNDLGVFFGEPGVTVPDPYFDGEGPPRAGCTQCGACFTGCRENAKNSLDKNYLWLAERRGATILPQTEVMAVRPRGDQWQIETRPSMGSNRSTSVFTADKVVLSGGVLGTVDLLLRMKEDPDGLPELSERTGDRIRTNSEALIGVTTSRPELDMSKGVAIGSILHTDDASHLEPCRYGPGNGLFRLMVLPHAPGDSVGARLFGALRAAATSPGRTWRTLTTPDWAKKTTILLYMRSSEGTLRFVRGRNPGSAFKMGLRTTLAEGDPPVASMPEATDLARRFGEKLDGSVMSFFLETMLDIPTTAHILGGACIGETPEEGVIDINHQVHGYPGLYVCDGAAISANPGVNPSLTITAMSERAMSKIPAKRA